MYYEQKNAVIVSNPFIVSCENDSELSYPTIKPEEQQQAEPSNQFSAIPAEVIESVILSFLNSKESFAMRLISRRFNELFTITAHSLKLQAQYFEKKLSTKELFESDRCFVLTNSWIYHLSIYNPFFSVNSFFKKKTKGTLTPHILENINKIVCGAQKKISIHDPAFLILNKMNALDIKAIADLNQAFFNSSSTDEENIYFLKPFFRITLQSLISAGLFAAILSPIWISMIVLALTIKIQTALVIPKEKISWLCADIIKNATYTTNSNVSHLINLTSSICTNDPDCNPISLYSRILSACKELSDCNLFQYTISDYIRMGVSIDCQMSTQETALRYTYIFSIFIFIFIAGAATICLVNSAIFPLFFSKPGGDLTNEYTAESFKKIQNEFSLFLNKVARLIATPEEEKRSDLNLFQTNSEPTDDTEGKERVESSFAAP